MVDLVLAKREQILRLARRHGVTGVRIFDSMARGDAGPQSDVDLLIEVWPHMLRCNAHIEEYTGL